MAYRSVMSFLEVVLCTPHRRRAALVALLATELTILARYVGW